jgi:transcription initiation factor TFIIB
MEKLLEFKPEWRAEPSKEVGRADITAGVDITQHDLGLGSRLSRGGKLSPTWRARLHHLQLLQRRARATRYGEKSLREALLELDKLCEDLSLPKGIKAEVSSLYRRAKASRLTMGRGTWQVLASLTFITCRLRGVARTEAEVAEALAIRAELEGKAALRSLRQLTKLLARKMNLSVPRPVPEDYIDRFCSKLKLPKRVAARAHEICSALPSGLRGSKPATLLAASAIYEAARFAGLNLTIRKIAKALGVGVSSLCQTAIRVREYFARV